MHHSGRAAACRAVFAAATASVSESAHGFSSTTLGHRNLDTYTRDELIDFIPSVLHKGQTFDRQAMTRALLHHLGFHRLTDPAQDALKSALNGAIRRGFLEAVGTDQVRRLS